MAKKSCALIGPGQGPIVALRGTCRVVVRGIKADEFVTVVQRLNDTEDVGTLISADGEYPLQDVPNASVCYEGKNPRFIATIMMEA